MVAEKSEIRRIKHILCMCNTVYTEFKWLLDAYVLDFYTGSHWNRLPKSWQVALTDLEPESLSTILDFSASLKTTKVLPLSLISLRLLIRQWHLPRNQKDCEFKHSKNVFPCIDSADHPKTLNLFWKQVKLKKRHEIEQMAKICYRTAREANCDYVVDIGSGLGHLSRTLSYGYGLNVCALEAQHCLTTQARLLDKQFEVTLGKHVKCYEESCKRPVHVNYKLTETTDVDDFLQVITNAFNSKNHTIKFGIVGLHPCGNLGSTLLQLFQNCPQAMFINIASCCYMKLSTTCTALCNPGFPLSTFCLKNEYDLSYHSREIACHAIESYVQRLRDGNHWELKIHAYRAALEKIITLKWPHLCHCQLQSMKYSKDLTFVSYCNTAMFKLGIKLEADDACFEKIGEDLVKWKQVIVFYSLRLMLAPLVETIILLDRVLFILEAGHRSNVIAAFDPKISPRNHIIFAKKVSFK